MATLVVEQPDNVPCIAVSEHNPYKNMGENLCVEERHPVYFGSTMVSMPSEYIIRAHEIEQFAVTIRMVTLMDTVLCCVNFIFTGHLVFILAGALNYAGYWGTQRFNKLMLVVYIIYQWFSASSKLSYVILEPGDTSVSTVLTLSAMFNIIMSIMVTRFIRRIPS